MKKFMFLLIFGCSVQLLQADHGGGAFFGGLAGSMVGGAIVNAGNSHRSSRREIDELRREQQQKELADLRREQDSERNERERRMLESKIDQSQSHGNMLLYVLWGLVFILLVAIIGLAVVVLRKK